MLQQDEDNIGKLGPGEVFVYGTKDLESSAAFLTRHRLTPPRLLTRETSICRSGVNAISTENMSRGASGVGHRMGGLLTCLYFFRAGCDSQSSDALVNVYHVWTPDRNSGDRKSCLLGEGGFDNGRCYQISNSPMSIARQVEFPHPAQAPQGVDIWCSLNVTVPSPLSSGTLTLYWVWEWPAVQRNEDVDKFYTTCMNPHRT